MKNIVNYYIEKFRKEKELRHRVISVLACLAVVVAVGVFWNLRETGISMTAKEICGLEEHIHEEICYEQYLTCEYAEVEVLENHEHTTECNEQKLTCENIEHTHVAECLEQQSLEKEDASVWEATLPTSYSGVWSEDVVAVANSQMDYIESQVDVVLDEESGESKGYNRYGAWFGNEYADWNSLFVSFCMHYAGVNEDFIPGEDILTYMDTMFMSGIYYEGYAHEPELGDVIFLDTDEDYIPDRIGYVSECKESEIIVIEGDYENKVSSVTYGTDNTVIIGYCCLSEAQKLYSVESDGQAVVGETISEEIDGTHVSPIGEGNVTTDTPTTTEVVAGTESPAATEAAGTEAPATTEEVDATNASITSEIPATTAPEDEAPISVTLETEQYDATITEELSGTSGTISWTLTTDGVLTISGSGTVTNLWADYATSVTKIVVNEGITAIGDNAFNGYTAVTSVSLPNTLTSIGVKSFYGCSVMSSVNIPDSVTSIGEYAFFSCKKLTSVVIPEGITSIGQRTFGYCYALASVSFPGSVTSIGKYAFAHCTSLVTLNLHEGLQFIDEYAFRNCEALTTLNVPSTVTSIAGYAFCNCKALNAVTLPEGLKSIETYAFQNCYSLTSIVIPEGVESIGSNAFAHTPLSEVSFPSTLKTIGSTAFYGTQFTSLEIPGNVTTIDRSAFNSCKKIKTVVLEDGIESIAKSAFKNCTALTSIEIPQSVKTINEDILSGCTALKTITYNAEAATDLSNTGAVGFKMIVGEHVDVLPTCFSDFLIGAGEVDFVENNIINLEEDALVCEALTSPLIDYVGEYCFGPDGMIFTLDEDNRTATLIYVPDDVTDLVIPAYVWDEEESTAKQYAVTGIAEKLFNNNDTLISVELPSTMKEVGKKAFYDCDSLTTLKLPVGLEVISYSAFQGCSSLNYVEIPRTVKNIWAGAFVDIGGENPVEIKYNVASLSSVSSNAILLYDNDTLIIGKDVDTITSSFTSLFGNKATIVFEGPNVITVNSGAFNNTLYSGLVKGEYYVDENGVIYSLNTSTMEATLRAVSNKETITEFVVPETIIADDVVYTVTGIGQEAFSGCTSLTSVEIPDTVTSLDDRVFDGCTSLTSVELPDSVNSLGTYVFDGCKSLTSVKLSESLTSIPNYTFYNCTLLETVNIPNSITRIGGYAFYGCRSLSDINLPDIVTSISSGAFANCDSLSTIELPSNITSVDRQALYTPNNALVIRYDLQLNKSLSTSTTGLNASDTVIIGKNVNVIPNGFYNFIDNATLVFEGPNVFTIQDGALTYTRYSGVEAGTYYVDEYGALYSIDTTTKEATLRAVSGNPSEYKIPEVFSEDGVEYTVTGIGDGVFRNNTALTSVEIPDTVTNIGENAFYGCTSLTSIEIPDSVTNIGTSAFYNCTSLESVKLSNSLQSINNSTFYNCTALSTIDIPSSVTSIEGNAFHLCTSLEEISIPDSVISIGQNAFCDCDSLTEIIIPSSVTTLGTGVFNGCNSLNKVDILAAITVLDNKMFSGCTSLTDVTLPESLVTIGEYAFSGCTSLQTMTLPDTVKVIQKYAFSGCTSLQTIDIPDSLIQIWDYAFKDCTSLTSFKIPRDLEVSGTKILDGCAGLDIIFDRASGSASDYGAKDYTVTIGKNVDTLDSGVTTFLQGANSIKFVGPNVLTIEEGTMPATYERLSGELYVGKSGIIYRLNKEAKTASIVLIPDGLTNVKVEKNLTISSIEEVAGTYLIDTVESDALANTSTLKAITFANPSGITLEDSALANCETLTSVNGYTYVNDVRSLFKSVGTSAFVNTGLLYSASSYPFSKEDPTGTESITESLGTDGPTISIVVDEKTIVDSITEGDNGSCYNLLTGNTLNGYIAIDPAGIIGKYEYRVYVENTKDNCKTSLSPGETETFDSAEVTYHYTDIENVYYMAIQLSQGDTVSIPISAVYPNLSEGGGVRIWTAIVPLEDVEEDTYYAPTDTDSIQAWWITKHDSYTLSKTGQDDLTIVGDGEGGYAFSEVIKYTIDVNSTSAVSQSKAGDDPVKKTTLFYDELTLPKGVKWRAEVLEAVENNEIVCKTYGSYYCVYAGDAPFIRLYSYYGLEIKEVVFSENSVKMTFSLTDSYLLTSHTYEISGDSFSIDLDEIDDTSQFHNSVTTNISFEFSDDVVSLSDEVSTPISTKDAQLTLNKGPKYSYTLNRAYGQGMSYTLIVVNEGTWDYKFYDSNGRLTTTSPLLTDVLDDSLYISPSNMERMLMNTNYGDTLTITISNATLCTPMEFTEVTAVDGGTAYINYDNTTSDYEFHDVTIGWENENIVVTIDGTQKHVVTESLEQTLNSIGYCLIKQETQFTVQWDMSKTNNGVFYAGESRTYGIPTIIKDSFQRGAKDCSVDYDLSSETIKNQATCYNYATKLTSSASTCNSRSEVDISKSVRVNGSATYEDIMEGDILRYTVSSDFFATGSYANLPVVDTMTGAQKMLVPLELNTQFAGKGFPVKIVDDVRYYVLSKNGTYNDVYVNNTMVAEAVIVSDIETTIKLYFTSYTDSKNPTITYNAIVQVPKGTTGTTFSLGNTVWFNDRENNRLYDTVFNEGSAITADKTIYDVENQQNIGEYSVLSSGEEVTYRLSVTTHSKNGLTVLGTSLWDILPETYDVFAWEKDVNVKIWTEDNPNITFTGIDSEWSIVKDESTGLYKITWPSTSNIAYSKDSTAYIYVQLTFPKGDTWEAYLSEAAGIYLNNDFYADNIRHRVYHDVPAEAKVYLQKGVYEVESGNSTLDLINDRNYFPTSANEEVSTVDFYITLYNGGSARMYLSQIYDDALFNYSYDSNHVDDANVYTSRINVSNIRVGGQYAKYKDPSVKYVNADVYWISNYSYFSVSGNESDGTDGWIKYDSRRQEYYLDKGEALTFVYTCGIPDFSYKYDYGYITNSVRMKYTDYLQSGFELNDPGITHGSTSTSCSGTNDGYCKVLDGNVLESSVVLNSGEMIPGIAKSVTSYKTSGGSVVSGTDSVPYDSIVNWNLQLKNEGSIGIERYEVSDTIQAPYSFVTGGKVYMYIGEEETCYFTLPETAREEGGADVTLYYNSGKSSTSGTHVEIVKNEDGSETINMQFTSNVTGIPGYGYIDIALSTENTTGNYYNRTFLNEAVLTPLHGSFDEICDGVEITDEEGNYTAVKAHATVNTYIGYGSSSLKEVTDSSNTSNTTDSLQDKRYITLGKKTNSFRYTLNVDVPTEKVIDKLVIVDTLPQVGDHSPYDTSVARNSEFRVNFASNPNLKVTITNSDGTVNYLTSGEYQVLYSDNTELTEDERKAKDHTGWEFTNSDTSRSIRIVIPGSAIPVDSRVSVSFNANVTTATTGDDKAVAGEIAWNSFGYYYTVTIGSVVQEFEAMPMEVGVQIPYYPSLTKHLVYRDGESEYVTTENVTQKFLIHEGEAFSDYDNLTTEDFMDVHATIQNLTVSAGSSACGIVSLASKNVWTLEADGNWYESTIPFTWEDGKTYTIYEYPVEGYEFHEIAGQSANPYTFTYDSDKKTAIVCENRPTEWGIEITKVNSNDTSVVVPGAGFALYTTDPKNAMPDATYIKLANKPPRRVEVNNVTWYLLYVGTTDDNGKVSFSGLNLKRYYATEYIVPDGYHAPDSGYYFYYDNTVGGVESRTIENASDKILPMTGGSGIYPFVLIGLTIMSGSIYLWNRRRNNIFER